MTFNGIVVEKYIIDIDQIHVLCIKEGKTVSKLDRDIFKCDKSGLWEYVQPGDSIFKKVGINVFAVKRNDKTDSFELRTY